MKNKFTDIRNKEALPVAQSDDRYHILAVDDEPIVHKALGQIISECDLPVVLSGTATSASAALKKAEESRPDICLLDIRMGGMDGLELAERLKNLYPANLQIIYITAYDQFEYAKQAILLGAVDYLLKPIKRADVINALKRAVNLLEAERIQRLEREQLLRKIASVVPDAGSESDHPKESRSATVVREVKRFIDRNYKKHISLSSAAEHLQLSTQYLGSLFKAESGFAFRSYLRTVRILHAKELMQNPRLNLTQVALAVGYEDINSFSQAFLKETGMRPSEYHGEGRRWAR